MGRVASIAAVKTLRKPLEPHNGSASVMASTASLAASLSLTLGAVALSVPPLRHLIEQSMVWHMVVQMPLLVWAGWWSGGLLSTIKARQSASQRGSNWNQLGLTGALAAFVVLAYWMLPSSIDRALVVPPIDAIKLISLWLCGALLQRSAMRAPSLLQLFFMGSSLPMLVWAGLYFASTDLRLCNAYSLDSQVNAGRSLATLGASLGGWWTLNAVLKSRASS